MLSTLLSLAAPRSSTTVVLLAAIAACGRGGSGDATGPEFSRAPREIRAEAGGLTQTLRLSATSLRAGDVLEIRSTLTNAGAQPVFAESRTCGLDLDMPEGLRGPDRWARCGGYSTAGPLAPGASLTDSERVVVAHRPGVHTIRVRHLLEPELWISVDVTVR
jgi:hypothetical protein